jgi:hypothetical protein
MPMPLSTGTRLGPYEVVATIGAGGMGEVYRARDTTLDRDVALKILPEAQGCVFVSSDPAPTLKTLSGKAAFVDSAKSSTGQPRQGGRLPRREGDARRQPRGQW